MTTTPRPARAMLTINDEPVATLPCVLVAGHDAPVAVVKGDTIPELRMPLALAIDTDETVLRTEPGTKHRFVLEWTDTEPSEPFPIPE